MKRRKHSLAALAAVILAAAVALFTGYMAIQARTIHFRRATVCVPDLPPAFEGVKLLYATDFDIRDSRGAARASEALMRARQAGPDMLVLGGGYAGLTLNDLLDRKTAPGADAMLARSDFFYNIRDFDAPMGRYALAAPADGDIAALLTENGFTPLNDARFRIHIGDQQIWLAGVTTASEPVSRYGKSFRRDECVIIVADSPAAFPKLVTTEARDSGHWPDLCLAGGTHGGQIRLFGRSILSLGALEQQYLRGWNRETGVPMLTTSGVGCVGVDLRLGTQPEFWLITLTSQSS